MKKLFEVSQERRSGEDRKWEAKSWVEAQQCSHFRSVRGMPCAALGVRERVMTAGGPRPEGSSACRVGAPRSSVLCSPDTLPHCQLTLSFLRPRKDLPGHRAPLCLQLKLLAPGPISHVLPSSTEPGGNLSTTLGGGWEHWCLAQGGSWKPESQITAFSHRIKGAQSKDSLRGWACWAALEPGQAALPSSARPAGRQAAQRSCGQRTGVELASIFPSSCHKGQGPSEARGDLSWGEDSSAW